MNGAGDAHEGEEVRGFARVAPVETAAPGERPPTRPGKEFGIPTGLPHRSPCTVTSQRTAPPSSSGRPHRRTPAGSATSASDRDAASEPGPNPLTISHPASPSSQANTGSAAADPATETCA